MAGLSKMPADGNHGIDGENVDIVECDEENDDFYPENEEHAENDDSYALAALDQQLDQLNSCLDVLEQKNDNLRAELQELLESSRQTRQELEAARNHEAK